MVRYIYLFSFIIQFALLGCKQKSEKDSSNNGNSENRELTIDEFKNDAISRNDSIALIQINIDSLALIKRGFTFSHLSNGEIVECKNYVIGIDTNINNTLEVDVGSGTDVVIKLMSLFSGKCIRYFHINSGSSFTINNIPEGKYQLKIAYGKSWMTNYKGGECLGRFIRKPIYEAGSDTLDYFNKKLPNGIQIPSYKLRLDVISSGIENSFNSNRISEDEFNK